MGSRVIRRRSFSVLLLIALLLIQGLGALGGGAALVASPSGSIVHMPVSYLDNSPFPSYLIPGLILGLVLGVWPLAAVVGVWRGRPWAWYSVSAIGCGLIIFEIVEVLFIPPNVLQAVFGAMGLLLALLPLLPSVRRWSRVARPCPSESNQPALGRPGR